MNEASTLHGLKQKLCFLACAPNRSRTYTKTFIVEEAAEIGTPEEHCEGDVAATNVLSSHLASVLIEVAGL